MPKNNIHKIIYVLIAYLAPHAIEILYEMVFPESKGQ